MANFAPSNYRILAVDDSSTLLDVVESTLLHAGFQVTTAVSGESALEKLKAEGLPHLALVDINMPFGMDGFEFCEVVHEYCDLPVIMVTGIEDEDTIVDAMEHHAEDYIVKPFNAGELIARVRRVLRSMGHYAYELTQPMQVDGRLAVDFPGGRIFLGDEEISLTPTETRLLHIMARDAGRTLTPEYLLRRMWPLERVYEDRLRVYIHRLRQKLESGADSPTYIKSKRGRGYIFHPDYIPSN